jgi:hypothetical protein
MKDAIIGAITNYDVPNVLLYVTSLLQSGFSGDKYMVVYDVGYDVVDFLHRAGWIVFTFDDIPEARRYAYKDKPKNFHVNVDRFYHMWYFLSRIRTQYRYLISTDVGDVVFQSNPIAWLEANLPEDGPHKLVAASESIAYGNESLWGDKNLSTSFGPTVFEHMQGRLIYNAGTMAGRFETVRDLFLNVFLMCGAYGTENPDQAAYNILLSLSPYRDITRFMASEDGWACQMGTSADPWKRNYFKEGVISEPLPLVSADLPAIVRTAGSEKPYVIIHQYNRLGWFVPRLLQTYVPGIRFANN